MTNLSGKIRLSLLRLILKGHRISTFVEPLLTMPAEKVQAILSNAPDNFYVGLSNMDGIEAWTRKKLRSLPAGLRLLDAGAGECKFKKDCAHLDYVAQDISQYDGKGTIGLQTGGWDTSQIDIVSDIVSIPEADSTFDVVLCTEVLEHVPDPVRALEEMARLTKHGGTILITAPFWSLTHFAPYHHATGFNRYFYEHHLVRLGFSNIEITPNGNFFESIAQELRRIPEMSEKFGRASMSDLEKLGLQSMLAYLEKSSSQDTGSSEYLCHGLMVEARKHIP